MSSNKQSESCTVTVSSLPGGDYLVSLIGGFSYAEIGQILDLPEGTVKTHLFRTREALKKAVLERCQKGKFEGMRCRQSREQLHLYIDGVLDEQKRRALEEHLAVCAKCRTELQLLRGIVEAVETEPLLEPRADFASRVMAGLPRATRRGVLSSENTFWVSGVAVAFMAATWLSLAYGPQVVGTLQRQISISAKIGRWRAFSVRKDSPMDSPLSWSCSLAWISMSWPA